MEPTTDGRGALDGIPDAKRFVKKRGSLSSFPVNMEVCPEVGRRPCVETRVSPVSHITKDVPKISCYPSTDIMARIDMNGSDIRIVSFRRFSPYS